MQKFKYKIRRCTNPNGFYNTYEKELFEQEINNDQHFTTLESTFSNITDNLTSTITTYEELSRQLQALKEKAMLLNVMKGIIPKSFS